MKRFISLFMAVCMVLCMAAPAMAETADLTGSLIQFLDSSETEESPIIGESDSEVSDDVISVPDSSSDPDDILPEDSLLEDTPRYDSNVYNTVIRLIVKDNKDTPLQYVEYGLYSEGGVFLDELITDEFGVAESIPVNVGYRYYLMEITAPEGYQSKPDKITITLNNGCPPSRIDVVLEYEPIVGRIKVIKSDEDGNRLPDVGFRVYQTSPYKKVDEIRTGADGTAITKDLPYGQYELSEFDTPDGFVPNKDYYAFISEHDATVELPITNYRSKGKVKITKTGNNGKKIPGTVFDIYNAETDVLLETVTTGTQGYVWSNYMPMGYYYAVETSVPAPYKLDTARHNFSLAHNSQSVYLEVENEVDGTPGKVKILKTDENDNPLSDVKFALYRTWDDKRLGFLTTSKDGTAESDELIPDDYYLIETVGKPGYTHETGKIHFTIDGTGVTVEKKVVNPRIPIFGTIQVLKHDEAENPLPGVRFGIYSDGSLVEELITGEDGTATSGTLKEGDYYLIELEGIPGYLMDTEQHPFSIAENNVVVPIPVTNPHITGTVKVIKTNTEDVPLPGVVFGIYQVSDDSEICQITTEEDGTVTSPPLFYGDYYLKELSTVDGFELIETPIPFSIMEQDAEIEIPVSNHLILGSVSVYKVSADTDEEGNEIPLSGAVFGLYNKQGQKLAEITSGSDGRAIYEGIPKGSYYLKELIAPEGFVLTDELLPFTIETQGQLVELKAVNQAGFGTLEVSKVGEENAPLSGVRFDVFHAVTAEKVGELVTDDNGFASLTLPLGRYYLVETATAEGYLLLSGQISFSLIEDGATIQLPIMNQKESGTIEGGHIRLLKKDADTNVLLPGAFFGIFRVSDNKQVGEIVTGMDGTATSLRLPADYYYLLELRAPEHYEASTEKYPVTVTDGSTAEIIVTNRRTPEPEPESKNGTVTIIKTDAQDGKIRLPGAIFSVYETKSGKKVGELLTDKDGKASLEIPEGDYTLRETTAPEGYQLSTEPIQLLMKAGETKEIVITNHKEKPDTEVKNGTVKIIKTDAQDGKIRLSGAVFSVYETKSGKKVGELLTDKEGAASLELPEGDYTLKETAAPEGYQISTELISLHLKADEIRELTITNRKEEPGTIRIIKEDKEGGKKLKGAIFGVYNAENDKLIEEITTDQKGMAELELAVGDYYLKELEAPEGYQLKNKEIPFSVQSGEKVEKIVKNTRDDAEDESGTLLLIKEDKETGDRLKNAVFAIFDKDGDKIDEVETGKDGAAELDLEPGSYTLKELEAPKGYKRDKKEVSFKISTGKTTKVTIKNEKEEEKEKTGKLHIIKSAAGTGKRLSGATFAVYAENGDKKLSDLTTDKNGIANLDLPAGNYYLKEQKAPNGFKLETARILFTISIDTKTVVEVTNERDVAGTAIPSNKPEVPDGTTQVIIPQTGEFPPAFEYMMAAICFGIAIALGFMLQNQKKRINCQ